jgi:hypothetical protein
MSRSRKRPTRRPNPSRPRRRRTTRRLPAGWDRLVAVGKRSRVGRWLGHQLRRLLTPFSFGVLGCLFLAGWALWSGGVLDGPIAREVRTSSVYVAPGVELDEAAAERIIGNRRLVVVMLAPDADLRAGCQEVTRAAAGTVVLLLKPDGDGYDHYGCALVPGYDGENFGRAFVTELRISRGIDAFPGQPLEAVKMVVLNYDLLVKAGTIPDGARTVSPSLPRYLVAGAAVLAVCVGSTVAYAAARQAGRRTARYLARREALADLRAQLAASISVLAAQLIELDRYYPKPDTVNGRRYRKLAAEYLTLLDTFATTIDSDEVTVTRLIRRAETLSARCRMLADARDRSQTAKTR